MDVTFVGKYKSLSSFTWLNIPDFVVITGPNGTGKSQLLDLIYNTLINKIGTLERVSISGKAIKPNEVTFLRGEWQLQNTDYTNLAFIQQYRSNQFNQFRQQNYLYNNQYDESQIRLFSTFRDILAKSGKSSPIEVGEGDFYQYFPEVLIERESQMSQKISEIFYNYRLSEIELLAEGKNKEEIIEKIGEKPWVILKEIFRASKLPFETNDPATNGFRDSFQLKLYHQVLNEEVNFNDLSSGEKVLISLVFYLYNSQEKSVFPKLLLLDEPDAHLHPSMSQQFLNVIKNVLVDKFGVQVIMTTHSPSTVILAPDDSIYEMSRVEPRIKKSSSKNHSVSLLTAGLVYVGSGTKYFLVEDNDDVLFYSHIYGQLALEGQVDTDVPLVFIAASTKDKSGGKDVVQNWVGKLRDSGLVDIVHGLIDADSGNAVSDGVYKIDRYSIENYLVDPILVYAVLMDKEKNPQIPGLNLALGEEYKLKNMSNELLQKVANAIFSMLEPTVHTYFKDFNTVTEMERVSVKFSNGTTLLYPRWIFNRRGKTLLNELYNTTFSSTIVNFTTLFKAMRKLNIFSNDLIQKFSEIKAY